jgi:multidrug efflux pump subunit AcrA (membrane-fusion protein)
MNSQHVVWNHHFRAVTLATVLILITATATSCGEEAPPAQEARPVRTVTVEGGAEGETVSLTGQIRAKDEVSLAFRLDGRMIERPVNVGDVLKGGQVVARLDPQNQQNELRSAQANVSSAEAALKQAQLTFGRQQQLLKEGWTPRAPFR